MKTLLSTFIVCLSTSALSETKDFEKDEQKRIQVIDAVSPAVVAVMDQRSAGGGSGVLISADGYALTNYHVTSAAGDQMKCGLPDGKRYDAVIVGIDPSGDVSVIKLAGREDFPFAKLGDSDHLEVGEWVLAMGNPFLLATDFTPTVTYGIISGLHRYQYPAKGGLLEYPDCIQVDASINPGNSGGPLFNMEGEVIGINGRISFEKRVRVNSGFGYAISSNQIKKFLHALKGGKVVDHASLGATVGTDEHGRVIVREVLVDSDAFRRGMREDDELVEFAGRKVTTVNDFKNILGTLPSNWRVPVTFHRGTEKFEAHVRLSGVHGQNWDYPTLGKKKKPTVKPQPLKKQDLELKKSDKPDPKAPEELEENEESEDESQPEEEKLEATKEAPPAEKQPAIEKKPGFANYIFNRIERDRVLAGFLQHSQVDLANRPRGPWAIGGNAGRARFSLRMNDDAGEMSIADMDFVVDQQNLWGAAGDDGTALLRALMYWRQFILTDGKGFESLHYDGRVPSALGECDVLATNKGAVEVRWYFLVKTGMLRMVEVSFDRYSDPYEVIFGPPAMQDGMMLPTVLLAKVGDEFIGKFNLRRIQMMKAVEEAN